MGSNSTPVPANSEGESSSPISPAFFSWMMSISMEARLRSGVREGDLTVTGDLLAVGDVYTSVGSDPFLQPAAPVSEDFRDRASRDAWRSSAATASTCCLRGEMTASVGDTALLGDVTEYFLVEPGEVTGDFLLVTHRCHQKGRGSESLSSCVNLRLLQKSRYLLHMSTSIFYCVHINLSKTRISF